MSGVPLKCVKNTALNRKKLMGSIDDSSCGAVYPRSAAENIQQGYIYINERSVLLHHYCGFAFLFGSCDEETLGSVYDNFLSIVSTASRRFILFSRDENVISYFNKKENVIIGQRYFFEYPNDKLISENALSEGFSIGEFKKEYFESIEGRVTPRFSWSSPAEFDKYGKGFCVMEGKTIAACAFSAAVSSDEIDIGIETSEQYRHMGLGTIAVQRMIQYCLEQRKRPVWACDAGNTASQKLAERSGFIKTNECFTFRRER